MSAQQATVWIGTATSPGGASRGIYRATLDLESGALTEPTVAAEIASPGFLVLRPDGQRLYSLCGLENGEGGVAAFEVTAEGQPLRLLNTQPIGDGAGTHLALDPTNRCLFTAQYGSGSVAAFPVGADGTIGPRSALVRHEGSGPNRQRQEKAHPHQVVVDPTNHFLSVPDLGIDEVVIYKIDLDRSELERHGSSVCPPGSGPRHMRFHPNGKFAFVLTELGLSVVTFRFDPQAGTLEMIDESIALPPALRAGADSGSEIQIHPSGKFLYAAIRGHDSIAAFEIEPETGKLTFIEHEPVRGSHPRHFNLDPSGKWLLAAGRDSNTIAVFRIDQQTGGLKYTSNTVSCPAPQCVQFAPMH
ncbi:MAG: lactonase family protein [Pirellulales bacterium]